MEAGNEPVREWLRELSASDRKLIGADILAVQWKWPVGKPLVDSLGSGLWEVRSSLGDRIARVFFIVVDQEIILQPFGELLLYHRLVVEAENLQLDQYSPLEAWLVAAAQGIFFAGRKLMFV